MPNEINMVTITETTARWIIETGKRIIREAYNSDWDPRNPLFLTRSAENEAEDFSSGGFMDELDQEEPALKNWLNGIIQLVRTITAICADQLPADEYLSGTDSDSEDSEVVAAARALFQDEDKENLN